MPELESLVFYYNESLCFFISSLLKRIEALEEYLGSEQDEVSGGIKETVLSVRIPVCENPISALAIEPSICPVGNCC